MYLVRQISPSRRAGITLLKLCNLLEDNKKKVLTEAETASGPEAEHIDTGQASEAADTNPPADGPGPETASVQVSRKKIPETIHSIKDALNGIGKQDEDVSSDKAVKQEKTVMSDPFTQEDLLDQWNKYAEKIKAEKPRMASSLKHHLPSLKEDQKIEVILSNSAQFQQFNREIKPDLLTFLEDSFKNNQFEVITVLAKADEKQNNLYTAEEKFDHMLRKNPSLGKLKERFNLDFE